DCPGLGCSPKCRVMTGAPATSCRVSRLGSDASVSFLCVWCVSWAVFTASDHDALPFKLWVVAKVDEQSEAMAGRVEVIDHLCPVFVGESRDGLEFHQDFVEANHVR